MPASLVPAPRPGARDVREAFDGVGYPKAPNGQVATRQEHRKYLLACGAHTNRKRLRVSSAPLRVEGSGRTQCIPRGGAQGTSLPIGGPSAGAQRRRVSPPPSLPPSHGAQDVREALDEVRRCSKALHRQVATYKGKHTEVAVPYMILGYSLGPTLEALYPPPDSPH